MSGGSYSYLCHAELASNYQADLERMAERLEELKVHEAAAETRRFLLPDADEALRDLWHAVEWRDSLDWSDEQVAEAVDSYRTRRMTMPAPTPATVADPLRAAFGWPPDVDVQRPPAFMLAGTFAEMWRAWGRVQTAGEGDEIGTGWRVRSVDYRGAKAIQLEVYFT